MKHVPYTIEQIRDMVHRKHHSVNKDDYESAITSLEIVADDMAQLLMDIYDLVGRTAVSSNPHDYLESTLEINRWFTQ